MEEIWKDIKGYEGLYQVSNLGRIKSLANNKNKKEKIRKTRIDRNGYEVLCLCKDCKTKTFLVHQLVGKAFVKNPHNYKEINHKDENKLNNYVENLEWCDRKYNINFGERNKKCSIKLKESDFKKKKVFQYDIFGNLLKTWNSVMEMANYFKIKSSTISNICTRRKFFGGKYYLSYVKENKENIIIQYEIFQNKNKIINLCNKKYQKIYSNKVGKQEHSKILQTTNEIISLLNKMP